MAIVTSDSMEPVLHRGDMVVIRKSDDYTPGDVVVFEVDYQLYIHRILARNPQDGLQYRTKGDGSAAVDQWIVRKGDIRGKVVLVIPKVGYAGLILDGQ